MIHISWKRMGMFLLGGFLPCLLFFSSTAWACSCAWPDPPTQAFENSPAVFIGKVITVKEIKTSSGATETGEEVMTFSFDFSFEYTVKVEKAWKGVTDDTITMVHKIFGSCSYGKLELGNRLLFYVGRSDEGFYYGPGPQHCTRNKPADSALVEALILDAVVAKKDLSTVYKQLPGMIRNHPDPSYRGDAALYLAFETPDPLPKDTLPALLAGLKDSHPKVRGNVALAFIKKRFRKHRELLAPVLEAALNREETLLKNSSDPKLNKYAIRQISGSLVVYGNLAARKKTVPHFIHDLESTEYFIYSNAVRQLKIIGPDAQAAVPALKKLLEKAETTPGMRTGRRWILEALKEIQPQGSLSEVRQALNQHNCGMVEEAVETLDQIESTRSKTLLRTEGVPKLVAMIGNCRLEFTLRRMDASLAPHVLEISALLNGRPNRTRASAAEILGDIGPSAKAAVPDLEKALNDPDPKVRWKATQALRNILGVKGRARMVKLWLKQLTDPDAYVRFISVLDLVKVGTPEVWDALNRHIVPRLINEWNGRKTQRTNTHRILHMLYEISPHAEGVFPVFKEVLDGDDEILWRGALTGLQKMGKSAGLTLPKLKALLLDTEHNNKQTRGYVVQVLQAIGTPEAEAAIHDYARWYVPKLLDQLSSKDRYERGDAPYYLRSLLPYTENLVPKLMTVFEDGDTVTRLPVLKVLKTLGSDAKDAAPQLITLFKEQWKEDEQSWQAIIKTVRELNTLGPDHSETAQKRSVLLEMLKRPELATRMFWVKTLEAIGTDEAMETARQYRRRVLPYLEQVITCDYKKARQQGVALLGKVAKGSKTALNLLISGLDDEAKRVRWQTVLALRDLGSAAAPAVPKLTFLLKEEGNFVGSAIPIALKAIGTEEALQALQ